MLLKRNCSLLCSLGNMGGYCTREHDESVRGKCAMGKKRLYFFQEICIQISDVRKNIPICVYITELNKD